MADFGAAAPVFIQEGVGIFDADPDPCAGVSLVAFTQENVAAAAGDGGEEWRLSFGELPIFLEAKNFDEVLDAGGSVLHAQNWADSSETNRR